MIGRLIPLAMLALLAGCGDGGGNGTTISLDTKNGKGQTVAAGADGETGQVSIDAPGFKASIDLPKINLNAENMDLNGVKLFPGSAVESLNIRGNEAAGKKDSVEVAFDAPAAQADVGKWFDAQLREAGYAVTSTANGLTGTSADGEPFSLALTAAGDRTRGTITVQDRD